MSRARGLGLLAACMMFAVAAPAWAHHGVAGYVSSKSTTIEGTVTKFDFSNPHTILALDVKDANGKVVEWQAEMTSPNHLMREGWTKTTLKPGDMVTISGYPSKSGANSVWIKSIAKSGGRPLPLTGDEN